MSWPEAVGEGPGERLRVWDGEDVPAALCPSVLQLPAQPSSTGPQLVSGPLTWWSEIRTRIRVGQPRVSTEDGVEEDGLDPREGPASLCVDERGCNGRVLADLPRGRFAQMPEQPGAW